jgi:hypothetical protein
MLRSMLEMLIEEARGIARFLCLGIDSSYVFPDISILGPFSKT